MKTKEREQLIHELPSTFLDMVFHGTTIVIDGQIIEKGSDFSNQGKHNRLIEDDNEVNLLVLENIARLENKYRLDNNNEISDLQKKILHVEQDLTDVDLDALQSRIRLKNYLLGNVLPLFKVSDNKLYSQVKTVLDKRMEIYRGDIDEAELDKMQEQFEFSSSSSSTSTLLTKLSKRKASKKTSSHSKKPKKEEKSSLEISRSKSTNSIFVNKVLENQNIYVSYANVYTLKNEPWFDDIEIVHNGKKLYPHPGIQLSNGTEIKNLKTLKELYKGSLVDFFEQEAIDNNPFRKSLVRLDSQLDEIFGGDFMNDLNLGVQFTRDNSCYLTKDIDEFVLKELHSNQLHWFGPTRIGVNVTCQRDGSISHGPVVIMDSYMPFPFLNSRKSFTSICTGDGKEIYEKNDLPDANQIAMKINIGVQTMYRGYHGDFTPYKHLDDSSFHSDNNTHKRISQSEYKKMHEERGVKITNVYR